LGAFACRLSGARMPVRRGGEGHSTQARASKVAGGPRICRPASLEGESSLQVHRRLQRGFVLALALMIAMQASCEFPPRRCGWA
jgi:hypothetical protein